DGTRTSAKEALKTRAASSAVTTSTCSMCSSPISYFAPAYPSEVRGPAPLASRAAARGLSTFEAGLRLNASSSWSRSEAAMRDSIPATVSAIVVPAPRWPSAISVMRARLPAGTHGCGDWCIGDSFVVGAQASGLRFGRGTAIGLQQPVEELIGGDALGPCGGLEAVEIGRASCRERVEDWDVGEACEKRMKNVVEK